MAARRPTTLVRAAFWPATVAITIFAVHVPSFVHRLLDGDEAIYGSIAVVMNMGGDLYGSGGVDNKPPGVFWIYALTFRVFGAYDMTAVHAVGFLAMAATCGLIFVLTRRIADRRIALLAALFYGVLTAAGNPRLLASNTEIFMMLPLTASVLLALQRRWFWSALFLVAAGAFRQSAATNLVVLGLGVFWLEDPARRWRAAQVAAAGLVAGLIAGALLIALTGWLPGFWRWTIATLVGYASTNWTPAFVWMRARDSVLPFLVDMAVFWIAAVALATRWRTLAVEVRLVVVWLVVAMIGSLAGGHLSWHYFIQAMGPLAILAAIAFERFPLRRVASAAAVVGIAIPVVAWWSFDLVSDPLTYDFNRPPQHEAVAAYIAAHTSPADNVFVWGDWPALYVESDRVMACRFPGFLRGFARGSDVAPNNWDTAPDVWPLLESDLNANPPALIVDTAAGDWSDFAKYPMSDYPVVAKLVSGRYHQVATIDGVVIYARNEA
jgi:4-amino-4-deoxy-L-arabinose transferase-like glycosyltransferase